jgi:hypothetical protein
VVSIPVVYININVVEIKNLPEMHCISSPFRVRPGVGVGGKDGAWNLAIRRGSGSGVITVNIDLAKKKKVKIK